MGLTSIKTSILASTAVCRKAAQCESLGHRPRNQAMLNTKALKGRNVCMVISPLQGFGYLFCIIPGRCPGLSHFVPLAPNTGCNILRTARRFDNRALGPAVFHPGFAPTQLDFNTNSATLAYSTQAPGKSQHIAVANPHFRTHVDMFFPIPQKRQAATLSLD